MAGQREPFNSKYCEAQSCTDLKGNDMCKLEMCVYSEKRVQYWIAHQVVLTEDVPVYDRVEIR